MSAFRSQTPGMKRLVGKKDGGLRLARVQIAQFNNPAPPESTFRADDVFWIDICLTPRRPKDRGRYVDHWNPHRFASLGSIIAFPPGETLCLRTLGGRRSSLICQLRAAAVRKWLDRD